MGQPQHNGRQPAQPQRRAPAQGQQRQYNRQQQPAQRQPQRPAQRPAQQPQRRPAPQPQQARSPAAVLQQYARRVQVLEGHIRKQQAEIAALIERDRKREAAVKQRAKQLQYERQLRHMVAQGLNLDEQDIAAEVEDAKDLTAEQQTRRLGRIAKHYGRNPVNGSGLISTDVATARKGGGFTPAHRDAAVKRVQETGCSYAAAMEWAQQNI